MSYNQLGREFKYTPDTYTLETKCPQREDIVLGNDLYSVIPEVPYDKSQRFCTYPNDTFAYELPSDSRLEVPSTYPPYYPANPATEWQKLPLSNLVTDHPLAPLSPPDPHSHATLPHSHTPPRQHPDTLSNSALSGKLDPSKDSLATAQALAHMQGHSGQVPIMYWKHASENVNDIAPGEQEVKSHRFTTINRYTAERRDQPIVIKANSQQPPYTPSLYETPIDQSQKLVATGKLINGYIGQSFETFENQLPPPNTDKSLAKYQLKQPNPKLVWINGGYNNHNPPPRKREQPGEVFNPVSVKGGSVAFGSSNVYDPVVSSKVKMYAKRDVFNNRDGDLPVEPSMNGELPQGFVGYVQRDRYLPFLPATQELEKSGWMPISQDLNPDLTKREDYTGEVFTRTDRVCGERFFGPDGLVNGVEAAGDFPLNIEDFKRESEEQYYTAQPYAELGGNTKQTNLRPSLKPESGLPVNAPSEPNYGDVILEEISLKPTLKTQMLEKGLPLGQNALVVGNVVTGEQTLKPTLKNADSAFASGPAAFEHGGDVVTGEQTLKPTLKNAESAFASGPVALPEGGNVVVSEQTIRATLKLEDALRIAADPFLDVGEVLVSQWEVKPTLKIRTEEVFPVNAVSTGISNFFVSDTEPGKLPRRVNMVQGKYFSPAGMDVGEILPMENATSQQYRGRSQEDYVTSKSRVFSGLGGSHCRAPLWSEREQSTSRRKTLM